MAIPAAPIKAMPKVGEFETEVMAFPRAPTTTRSNSMAQALEWVSLRARNVVRQGHF